MITKEENKTIDTDLERYCTRNSFYGKAEAVQVDNNVYLKSYDTVIAVCDMETGDISRTWDGHSATSDRHFKAFGKMLEHEGCIDQMDKRFSDYPYRPELGNIPNKEDRVVSPKKSLDEVKHIAETNKKETTQKQRSIENNM